MQGRIQRAFAGRIRAGDSGKQNRADEIHAESALNEPEEEISLECDDQREQGIRQEHRAQSNRRRIQREQQPGNQPGIVRAEKPPRKIDGENNRRPEQTSHHDTECETAAAYGEQPASPCRIQRGANPDRARRSYRRAFPTGKLRCWTDSGRGTCHVSESASRRQE